MSACPGSIPDRTACPLQARFTATSVDYWSGWVLPLAHLGRVENRRGACLDSVQGLHSTTMWLADLPHRPPNLTDFVQTSITKSTAENYVESKSGGRAPRPRTTSNPV